MYKKKLMSLGFGVDKFTDSQKSEFNRINRLESNYRLSLANDEFEESELQKMLDNINQLKVVFESTLTKEPEKPIEKIEPIEIIPVVKETTDNGIIGGLAIIGGLVLAGLFIMSGIDPKNAD